MSNRLLSSGSIDFRSSHSARNLQREAERGFSLKDYLRRKGAEPFGSMYGPTPHYNADAAKGVQARFGEGSVEDTRTWGNQGILQFGAGTAFPLTLADSPIFPSVQLIHVSRRRPTSFNILTVVLLQGGAWDVETGVSMDILYTVGVGQAQCQFINTIAFPSPTSSGLSIFNVDQFPLNAVQTQVTINITSVKSIALHMATVTQLAAPVFE